MFLTALLNENILVRLSHCLTPTISWSLYESKLNEDISLIFLMSRSLPPPCAHPTTTMVMGVVWVAGVLFLLGELLLELNICFNFIDVISFFLEFFSSKCYEEKGQGNCSSFGSMMQLTFLLYNIYNYLHDVFVGMYQYVSANLVQV